MTSASPVKGFAQGTVKEPIKERVISELKELVVISVYLFITFSALLFYKAALLHAEGIPFAPFGFAAAKSIICAKFVLLGNAFHLGERFQSWPLIWRTLHRSFVFLVLLLVLNSVEEVIVGAFHHRSITASLAEIGGGTLQQWIASSVVLLLALMPFFAFRLLGELVGEENLVRVFFHRRGGVDNA